MASVTEALRRLQAFERDVAAVRARLAALPERRSAIEAAVADAAHALAALQERLDELQAKRRQGESDASALQARLAKYRDQLMTVTTGREYEAMQHEIASTDGQLKALDDRVIGWLMEIDELQASVDTARAALAAARSDADVALAQLAAEEQKDRLELAAAEGHVQAERAALPGDLLERYDRVSKRYPLNAVAELKGESCSACNVRFRPMVVSEIRRQETIVQCDSCARLVVFVPPAPPPPAPDA